MEIQLQLDGNGRTCAQENKEEAKNAAAVIDFSSKVSMTSIANVPPSESSKNDHQELMDNVLFDCEISDCGLMPRTFWMPADGSKPRCVLEQMALDVFHHHVPSDCSFDATTSGAEWWVQIRPSPPTVGRYAMHDPSSETDDISSTGISFHWDKDEDLRLLAGGNLYVHPYLSTVTYLTSFGAPTMVVNCRVNTATGEWIVPLSNEQEAFVSWPLAGKHLSFDGQLLHAAPPDLMEPGAFEQQCKIVNDDDSAQTNNGNDAKEMERRAKILSRQHRRVTFLVNVWLNYKPFNVEPFPETMIDKLTRVDESAWKGLFASEEENNVVQEQCVTVQDDGKVVAARNESHKATSASHSDEMTQAFTWPMGDCDSGETIEMQMPLQSIRRQAMNGGNVRVGWRMNDGDASSTRGGICLRKNATKPEIAQAVDGKVEASTGGDCGNDSGSVVANESGESRAKRTKLDGDNNSL